MKIKKISLLILLISILALLNLEISQIKEKEKIELMVNNLKIKPYSDSNYNYIEIPRLKLKQIIIKGITNKNLNKNYVTTNTNLNEVGIKILAGHSIRNIFGKLHNIKLGDKIYINNIYRYKVIKKEIINTSDYEKLSNKKDTINLITCMLNPSKRLLVVAILDD